MKEAVFNVPDMSCGHCVATVQNALEQVDGVESADVSLDSKVARVQYNDDVDPDTLFRAVEAVGFTPVAGPGS